MGEKGSGGGGRKGRSGGGGSVPADKLYSSLVDGKISLQDARAARDKMDADFRAGLKNKNRSPAEQKKMERMADNLGKMEHAINLYNRGPPDKRYRRW